jgi:hypothetical protein
MEVLLTRYLLHITVVVRCLSGLNRALQSSCFWLIRVRMCTDIIKGIITFGKDQLMSAFRLSALNRAAHFYQHQTSHLSTLYPPTTTPHTEASFTHHNGQRRFPQHSARQLCLDAPGPASSNLRPPSMHPISTPYPNHQSLQRSPSQYSNHRPLLLAVLARQPTSTRIRLLGYDSGAGRQASHLGVLHQSRAHERAICPLWRCGRLLLRRHQRTSLQSRPRQPHMAPFLPLRWGGNSSCRSGRGARR